MLAQIYKPSLSLLTDLYQLTMAYGYWKLGVHDHQAVFHLHFRKNPFSGGYTLACGLADVVEYLEALRFDDDDIAFLGTLKGNDQQPLFDSAFLKYLRQFRFSCDVDAIPEGTVVFPHEPLVRVRGPMLQCQLLETPLLNLVNFQTLIATKASRVCLAARGDPVVEYGLRRAQGVDGSLTATRCAYIGGCMGTSSVLAAKLLAIPVRGTHAHSWVMSFPTETEAFAAYAQAMPNNCVFLVDTYNTLQGIRHAAAIGKRLKAEGHRMVGIRLDSGDLAYLSIEGRKILDEAGLPDAKIMASNDLDETLIESLKHQGAKIDIWGVGTHLVTAYDQPALGGVYKLGAVRSDGDSPWEYKVKLSESVAKTSIPGIQQVRRFSVGGQFIGDAIYDEPTGLTSPATIVDPRDMYRFKTIGAEAQSEDLLVAVYRGGKRVYDPPTIHESRKRGLEQVQHLHPTIRRFANPHEYPAGLDRGLNELRTRLILKARGAEA
ncbi:MAG TPA: nicotinate phosphoribosyltransferase [Tepidisphaeraceae bacterium]|jgi:nicotinate phosphoribosyltransferase|nr:nicotinate phosphoribosyltransferase [Tepidisphaeraceae bacterium]